jgi:hypothetical protein
MMRRRKEDDPFMASGRKHAQSELTCIAYKKKGVNIPNNIVLIVLLFQENKSFGAITICIHPLMYKKPCREQYPSTEKTNFRLIVTLKTIELSKKKIRWVQQCGCCFLTESWEGIS